MRVKIAGLNPHQQYYIAMDIVPVDNKRYRLGIVVLSDFNQTFRIFIHLFLESNFFVVFLVH